MTTLASLKMIARMEYGESLAQEVRVEGNVQVFGSNGVAGSHSSTNTLGPAIIVGRKGSFGKVVWSDEPGFCIDTAYYIDSRHTGESLRWLYWALQSLGLDVHSEDTGVPGLSREKAYQCKLLWPSRLEQERIANFLDAQTARIDALIAEKEILSARVEESLDASVSELVCGTTNTANDLRETNWRFLPRIPSHWDICHLRWIAKRVDVGIAEAATHAYAEEGVPILRSTNIRPNSIEGSLLRVQDWFAQKNASKTLFENDLVTVRTGYPGVTAVVPESLDGCQCFTLLITTLAEGFLPTFYARYMNAAAARGYFEVEAWGSAQQNISVPILKDLYVPRLPVGEQMKIVAACDRVEIAGRELVSHVRAHIDRLREYRSSLISAAVTGQLDLGAVKEAA